MTTANAYPVTQTIRTIGILGGGQLGMMLAQAALPLGYQCVFLEDNIDCPASLYGRVFSSEQLEDFIAAADVFTLEFENTPTVTVEQLAQLSQSNVKSTGTKSTSTKQGMFPPPIALDIAQDRLKEKQMFNTLDIATVPFMVVSSQAELKQACDTLGLPIVLKTSRGGYDGKGQYTIKQDSDIKLAWQDLKEAVSGKGALTPTPAPLIAEGFINFSREVSIIAARAQDGTVRCYDLVENHHHNGVLAKTQAPAVGTSHLFKQAKDAITTVMNHLGYVGVMALELFVTKDARGHDSLLANEIAPRVHNSGHWSIEGAITSQFENHIRAVVGLPLGDTDNVHPAIMVNVLGQYPDISAVLNIDGAHYHSYHKAERDDRKIAHITLMPNDVTDLEPALAKLVAVLPNKVGLDKKSAAINNTELNSASGAENQEADLNAAKEASTITANYKTPKDTNDEAKKIMQIWVDGDAVPLVAKELIIKTAERTETMAIFVANQPIKLRKSPLITMTVVPQGFDKADDYIVEHIQAGDLAITSDIPLANDILDKGGKVLTTRGVIYDKNNIKQKLNMRDFMDTMRGTGVLELQQMSGQKPYGDRDKKAFADGLNSLVRG